MLTTLDWNALLIHNTSRNMKKRVNCTRAGQVSSLITVAIFAGFGFAQERRDPQGEPTFSAVTVKLNQKGGGPYALDLPARLRLTYYSVPDLVALAYGLPDYQVIGKGFSEHYDIEGVADGQSSAAQMEGPMLQEVLKDRFKLKIHSEIRLLPIYELRATKGGIKMPMSKPNECTPFEISQPPLKQLAGPPPTPIFFCDHPRMGARGLKRTLQGRGISLDALAVTLSRSELNKTVVNRTGIASRFDVDIVWADDPSVPGLFDNRGGDAAPEPDEPNLLTALQEQLGLQLKGALGPVKVFIIDGAEKPSDN